MIILEISRLRIVDNSEQKSSGNATFAKKKKEQGLTEAEQKEQKELYKIYLGEIRTQFNATLDNVSVEEKDGTVKPFKEAYKKPYDKN